MQNVLPWMKHRNWIAGINVVEVLNEKPSNVVAENEIVEAIRDTSMEETRKPREKAERVRKDHLMPTSNLC